MEDDNKQYTRSRSMSEEHKKKISLANKGKKRSTKICQELSEQRKGRKRKPHSSETIEKIRSKNVGIKKRPMTYLEREIHSERVRLQWEERRKKFGPSGRSPKK